ncbi:MAG TPA: carbohydrate porin [Gallionella sp.]
MDTKLKFGKAGHVLLALFIATHAATAHAGDAPDWATDTLSGNWGGKRDYLDDRGVRIELTHKSDLLSNTSGGIRKGSAWLAHTEVAASVDLDKHRGWAGASAFIHYHVQHGNQSKDFSGSYVGTFAGSSNIETGTSGGQFFNAWLQQNLADDALSVLFGLYAIDSEFYVTDSSGLFTQPPYGMSAEVEQTGQSGPPVFPMGALALRLKYSTGDFYVQAALTDGVPGNPNNPRGTYVQLDKGDGTLSITELGYTPAGDENSINKTAVGVWNYTAPAFDLVTGEPRSDRGYYLLSERTLMAEAGGAGQGLSGFIRFGTANPDAYQADWVGSTGLHYKGLIDGRDDDEAGIAVTVSHAGSKYREAQLLAGTQTDVSEILVGLTYRAQMLPWLAVQPSVLRVMNPGMDKAVGDATVVGVRLELAL